MVSRYREELEGDGATREAHRRTVATAGRTVLFSGLTVAAAMIALVVFPQRFLYSVAVAGATVAILLSARDDVLAVPALLSLLGEPDQLRSRSAAGMAVSDASDGWYRLAWAVMRRPVVVALGDDRLPARPPRHRSSARSSPGRAPRPFRPSQPSYVVNEYVEENYDRSLGEGITVAVDGKTSDAELDALRRQIRQIAGSTAAPSSTARRPRSPTRPSRRPRRRWAREPGRGQDDPHGEPEAGRRSWSPATPRVHRPEGEPDRAHAARDRDRLRDDALPPLHADRLDHPADQDADHERRSRSPRRLGILVLAFQEGWLDELLDYTGPMAIEVTSLVVRVRGHLRPRDRLRRCS